MERYDGKHGELLMLCDPCAAQVILFWRNHKVEWTRQAEEKRQQERREHDEQIAMMRERAEKEAAMETEGKPA